MSDEERPSLDSILTPSQPEPARKEPVVSEPRADSTGRLHGEGGKFATKTPKVETPAAAAPLPDTGVKPIEPATPPVAVPSQPPTNHVPVQALIDQRLEARQAKQERDELRRQLAEFQKPKADPIDPYTDFDGALNQRSQQYVQPIVGQLRTLESEIAQLKAERVFGDKFGEFMTFIKDGHERNDPQVKMLEAVMSASPEPYAAAKQWYENRNFDANAERERMRAEILAELQGGGQPPAKPGTPATPAPVMPSNIAGARNVGTRAGPAWGGPTPLGDIFKR